MRCAGFSVSPQGEIDDLWTRMTLCICGVPFRGVIDIHLSESCEIDRYDLGSTRTREGSAFKPLKGTVTSWSTATFLSIQEIKEVCQSSHITARVMVSVVMRLPRLSGIGFRRETEITGG